MFDYGDGATGVFITCTHDVKYVQIDLRCCLIGKIVVEDSKRAVVKRLKKPENVMNKEMSMRDVMTLFMTGKSDAVYDER